MSFNDDFNANEVPEDTRTFDLLPVGWQKAQVIEAEIEATKTNSGLMLKLTWEIAEGPLSKRRVWQRINFANASAKAQEIGQIQLAELCRAVGIPGVRRGDDPIQIFGYKVVSIYVGVSKPQDGYQPQNEVKQIKPYSHDAGAPRAAAGARPGPAPSQAAATQTPQQRAPAATGQRPPVGRPWGQTQPAQAGADKPPF